MNIKNAELLMRRGMSFLQSRNTVLLKPGTIRFSLKKKVSSPLNSILVAHLILNAKC